MPDLGFTTSSFTERLRTWQKIGNRTARNQSPCEAKRSSSSTTTRRSATSCAGSAHAADKVTFLTSWYAQAEHGGFYQAKASGLYEQAGLDVVGEASNGVEAVTFALQHHPDFAILDYRLPRLDGEGAAEILRAVTPTTKIVAFSALLEERPQWADAYLNKDRVAELMPLLQTFIR